MATPTPPDASDTGTAAPSRVGLLVSPVAGRGRAGRVSAAVRSGLDRRGLEVVDLTGPDPGASSAAVADAVEAGLGRLILVGGDGLVHLALQSTAATPTVLGLVPVGTGNDLARAVGLPTEPEAALATALGPATALDAIAVEQVGGSAPVRWVATVATAGFSAAVNARANRLRRPRGASRYTVATLLELPRLSSHRLRLRIDGEPVDHPDVVLIAIANTPFFGGGMAICPDARPDDGLCDVTVVSGIGRVGLARFLPTVFDGRHVTHPAVRRHRGRVIGVEVVDAELDLWGDGEPVGASPVTLRTVPGALRLATT